MKHLLVLGILGCALVHLGTGAEAAESPSYLILLRRPRATKGTPITRGAGTRSSRRPMPTAGLVLNLDPTGDATQGITPDTSSGPRSDAVREMPPRWPAMTHVRSGFPGSGDVAYLPNSLTIRSAP